MDKSEKFLVGNNVDGGFLQSKHWVAFRRELGEIIHLAGNKENQTLIIENKLPIVGKYLYVPRGPIFGEDKKNNQKLLEDIREIAVRNEAGWIRIEPQEMSDLKNVKGQVSKTRKNHQPAETLMIDLRKDLDEILAGMKQKTRYNIRLAKKKRVKIKISKNKDDLEIFWKLMQETASRDGVAFHNKQYYQKMFKSVPRENLELLIAFSGDVPVGAVIISFFGGVATYLHGASSDEHRNLMANYLLQWRAIERSKEKGMMKYDFFGIAVSLNQKKWSGITRFKTGFCQNCEPIIFPGCYDLVLCPLRYRVYRFLQLLK